MSTATAPTQPAMPEPRTPEPQGNGLARPQAGEVRIAFRGVDFATYQRLCKATTGKGVRLSFDGKDLEIMSPSYDHEDFKKLLGKLAELLMLELRIPYVDLGSTRFKHSEAERGLEPDECYFFDPAKIDAFRLVRGSDIEDAEEAGCPVPDLAFEVDFSPPRIDRPGIYASLGVIEIWRLTQDRLIIERLQPDGSYRSMPSSEFLPIRPDEVLAWINDPGAWNRLDWTLRLQAWIRTDLMPRIAQRPDQPGTEVAPETEPA